LAQPAGQPYVVNKLYPQHKSLSIKHSLRCRQCEHNVIKPEYNPGSIKYRIQLFASYHVPEVRLVKVGSILKAGVANAVTLKMINPTINEMTITIMELPTADEEELMIQDMKKDFEVTE
jgi:dynactin 4